MKQPNNIIGPVKCTEDSFYRSWMEFLAPFHKLTARERDVAARIIAQYFKLSERITDPAVMKEVLWSQTSRKDMRESLMTLLSACLLTSGVSTIWI